MQNLGTEKYAVYAVLGGMQGWFLLADIGIASSLQNFISERRAHDQEYGDYIAAAGVFALLMGLFFLLLLSMTVAPIAAAILKGFPFMPATEKTRCFFMVAMVSIGTCVGSIAYRIWYAEQKGYLANILPAAASLISLAGIMAVAKFPNENYLLWSLTAAFLPPAVLPLMVFTRQFMVSFRQRPPMNWVVLRLLIRRGLKFWGFAIMAAGVLQVDYLVMSQFLEPLQIVIYNFATKIYALVFFIYGALLSAIWPVCAEALSRNDWGMVRCYIRKYIVVGITLIFISTVLLVFCMPAMVKILAPHEQITIPVTFILLLGGYQVLRVWTDTFGMALQSMSYLKPFWLYIPFQVILNVLLQWAMVPLLGVYGVVLGLIGSFAATALWVLPLSFYKRMKHNSSGYSLPSGPL